MLGPIRSVCVRLVFRKRSIFAIGIKRLIIPMNAWEVLQLLHNYNILSRLALDHPQVFPGVNMHHYVRYLHVCPYSHALQIASHTSTGMYSSHRNKNSSFYKVSMLSSLTPITSIKQARSTATMHLRVTLNGIYTLTQKHSE